MSVGLEEAAAALQGKRVLVTGGLGFIGSNLAERLLGYGAEVVLVDSMVPQYGGNMFNVESVGKRARINISDVRDPYSLQHLLREQDVLINLAGQTSHLDSMRDPFTDLEINCRSQLSILETCREVNPGVRIVFASTRQLYGKPEALPATEAHPLQPVDVNGINKMAGEWYHRLYAQVYSMKTTVLRLTNTYGPRMRVRDARQTFLGLWLKQVICGEPIKVFGDGLQLRDFNYVDDCVDAMVLAATSEAAVGEIFNLGAAPPVNLKDLAALLIDVAGAGTWELVTFPPDRKRIDIGSYYADYGHIERTLGWAPKVPLAEGLARSLAFYREHGPSHYWSERP